MTPRLPQPEFHRLVKLDALDALDGGPLRRDIEADERERQALAHRLDLLSLNSLTASVTLKRVSGGPLVRVEGRLNADTLQRCVVTLEPVTGHVRETFSELFGPPGCNPGDDEGEAAPEPLNDNAIDIGELVAQHLSLALDAYPRVPGAKVPEESGHGGGRRNPFAVLEALRKKR